MLASAHMRCIKRSLGKGTHARRCMLSGASHADSKRGCVASIAITKFKIPRLRFNLIIAGAARLGCQITSSARPSADLLCSQGQAGSKCLIRREHICHLDGQCHSCCATGETEPSGTTCFHHFAHISRTGNRVPFLPSGLQPSICATCPPFADTPSLF